MPIQRISHINPADVTLNDDGDVLWDGNPVCVTVVQSTRCDRTLTYSSGGREISSAIIGQDEIVQYYCDIGQTTVVLNRHQMRAVVEQLFQKYSAINMVLEPEEVPQDDPVTNDAPKGEE